MENGERVIAALMRSPGRGCCVQCLAQESGSESSSAVYEALAQFDWVPRAILKNFNSAIGCCSRCGKTRMVVWVTV